MGLRTEQHLVLVLAVEINQMITQLPDQRKGYRRIVDKRPRRSLHGNFPPDDQFVCRLVALALEIPHDHLTDDWLVVDHENCRHLAHCDRGPLTGA